MPDLVGHTSKILIKNLYTTLNCKQVIFAVCAQHQMVNYYFQEVKITV